MNNWDKSIKAITSAVDRTDYLYEKWAKKMGTQRVEMLIDTMNQYADLLETEMKTFYSK